jgi:5'-3' exoribonuclease 1
LGKKDDKSPKSKNSTSLSNARLESQSFYLLHLSILREYLQLEFDHIEDALDFTYDFERIIDDFILLAFFVGNDFLPNLPNLHINEGALVTMFEVYKKVLPSCGGYVNEAGIINLDRLENLLIELEQLEYETFESESTDQNWLRAKQTQNYETIEEPPQKGPLVITPFQKQLVVEIKHFALSMMSEEGLLMPKTLNAADRKFVTDLALAAGLNCGTVQDEDGENRLLLSFREVDSEPEEEGLEAMKRIFRKYERAQVSEQTVEEAEASMERKYRERFEKWKDDYYKVLNFAFLC